MSRTPSWMVPEVGVSRPATIRSVVVFPQPEGPSSAKNEPLGTSRSSVLTAVKFANSLVRRRRRRPSKGASSSPSRGGVETSATCDICPLSFVLLALLVVEDHEVERALQVLG